MSSKLWSHLFRMRIIVFLLLQVLGAFFGLHFIQSPLPLPSPQSDMAPKSLWRNFLLRMNSQRNLSIVLRLFDFQQSGILYNECWYSLTNGYFPRQSGILYTQYWYSLMNGYFSLTGISVHWRLVFTDHFPRQLGIPYTHSWHSLMNGWLYPVYPMLIFADE